MYTYGFNFTGRTTPDYVAMLPRNLGRSEFLYLSMYDAGHGEPAAVKNQLLRGLGITVLLELNSHVRSFGVVLKHANGSSRDVTTDFVLRDDGRYEWRAVTGSSGSLGLTGITDEQYAAGVEYILEVNTRNIHRTSRQQYRVLIVDETSFVYGAPTDSTEDFAMHRIIQDGGLMLWHHIGDRSFNDPDSEHVWMWVTLAEDFLGLAAGLCTALNWQQDWHVGLFFTSNLDVAGMAPGITPWPGGAVPKPSTFRPSGGCP